MNAPGADALTSHRDTLLAVQPTASEHPAFASVYIERAAGALSQAGGTGLITLLEEQVSALGELLRGVGADTAQRGYAPGKWTLAESLVHVADVERVFAYRLLRIARGDQTPLAGFDHDAWVPESGASTREVADILTEIEAVRGATLALVRTLSDTTVPRVGVSNGNPVSARALVWMIAGHFDHHLEITRTRYLGGA